MDVFGSEWVNHGERVAEQWRELIKPQDLVLLAGDISWAMHLEEALIDLKWIDQLPGTKVMIKGNHDYWWGSVSKVRARLPASCHVIQNDAFHWNDVSVAGARLWDTREYSFEPYINFKPNAVSKEKKVQEDPLEDEKIFERELLRLETSLKALKSSSRYRLAMTHYPPINALLEPSKASILLEKYRVDTCVFGHLHSVKKQVPLFGEKNGVRYLLTSCDYLDFKPIQLV